MPGHVPHDVQEFIFEHIDSIEQLDVLLLLRARADVTWSADAVGRELRTNPASAAKRLDRLASIGLLETDGAASPSYVYKPVTPELRRVVDSLDDACRIRRHQVYELIFSALKRSRKFLNAFTVVHQKKEDEGDND